VVGVVAILISSSTVETEYAEAESEQDTV